MKRILLSLLLLISFTACNKDQNEITIVTTTSLDNSGLLAYIIPTFEKEYDCKVKIVAIGTGAALELGKLKQADILLVHDKVREIKFVDEGYGDKRKQIMFNDFIFVGPEKTEVSNVFEMLTFLNTGKEFYSRGDNSGTHSREMGIWVDYGFDPSSFGNWYNETGQSMGATLNMASEKGTYTFTDRGTYLSMKENLNLVIAYENTPKLMNEYGVIVVSDLDNPLSELFYDWITLDTTKDLIDSYIKYGEQLFYTYRGE
jgi:tungstate transport system substrate-binding protein